MPHFTVLPEVVATTDLLLSVPSRMARRFAAQHTIRAFDLPFTVRKLDIMLQWHEHSGDIVAQRWLCQTLRECLAGLWPADGGGARTRKESCLNAIHPSCE